MNLTKKFEAYMRKTFDAEKIGKYLDNLGRGNTKWTTNDALRWASFFGSTLFILAYFMLEMRSYIELNVDIIKATENSKYLIEKFSILGLDGEYITEKVKNDLFLGLRESIQITHFLYIKKLMLRGLSLEALGIIIKLISCVRFVILSIRYNIPTSFIMVTISFLAAYVYYLDMISTLTQQLNLLGTIQGSVYVRFLCRELAYVERYYQRSILTVSSPVTTLLSAIGQTLTVKRVINEGGGVLVPTDFYSDPLSIIIHRVIRYFSKPDGWVELRTPMGTFSAEQVQEAGMTICKYVIESYYYFIMHMFKPLYKFITISMYNFRFFALFIVLVRVGKEWMPYLIRWHWTFLTLVQFPKTMMLTLIQRIGLYSVNQLVPEYRDTLRDTKQAILQNPSFPNYNKEVLEMCLFKVQLAHLVQSYLVIILVSCYVYAALHAVCGQYFYIPLFTENTELHIGYRSDSSLYSGGLTSWQDLDDDQKWRKKWHGLFGRGTDNVPLILIVFDFIKNLLVKLFRLFKR